MAGPPVPLQDPVFSTPLGTPTKSSEAVLPPEDGYILREDGDYMLREDGGRIIRES